MRLHKTVTFTITPTDQSSPSTGRACFASGTSLGQPRGYRPQGGREVYGTARGRGRRARALPPTYRPVGAQSQVQYSVNWLHPEQVIRPCSLWM